MIDAGHLKARMGAAEVVMSDDDLDALVAAVVSQWEELTLRLWLRRVGHVEEIRVESPITVLRPSLTPIASVSLVEELTIEPGDTPPLNYVTVPAAEYRVAQGKIYRLTSGGHFAYWSALGARITYTGGYYPAVAPGATQTDTPAAPSDVLTALYIQAEFLSMRTDQQRLVVAESRSMDGQNTKYLRPDYHPMFLETAARHRRMVV